MNVNNPLILKLGSRGLIPILPLSTQGRNQPLGPAALWSKSLQVGSVPHKDISACANWKSEPGGFTPAETLHVLCSAVAIFQVWLKRKDQVIMWKSQKTTLLDVYTVNIASGRMSTGRKKNVLAENDMTVWENRCLWRSIVQTCIFPPMGWLQSSNFPCKIPHNTCVETSQTNQVRTTDLTQPCEHISGWNQREF